MTIKQYIIDADADQQERTLTDLGDIYSLGIQAVPGTTFYLTGSATIENNLITIGPSGIYQVNFTDPILNGIIINNIVGTIPVIIDLILEEAV